MMRMNPALSAGDSISGQSPTVATRGKEYFVSVIFAIIREPWRVPEQIHEYDPTRIGTRTEEAGWRNHSRTRGDDRTPIDWAACRRKPSSRRIARFAKTRAIKKLSKFLDAGLSRIQFTPDLLPSDITGSEIYYSGEGKGEFRFQPGPVFNNLVLADEINRAPAKVQAALLEAMEERQVTVAGKTHELA